MTYVRVVDKSDSKQDLLSLGELGVGDFAVNVETGELWLFVANTDDGALLFSMHACDTTTFDYEENDKVFKLVEAVKVLYKTK
jgi:hypothetical protein